MASIINDLLAVPKQSFSVALDNVFWEIAVIVTNGCMSINLTRGGEPQAVVSGWRCVAGQLIIPKDREAGGGNFAFLTDDGDLPWWEQFGTTQLLGYVSAIELATIRNGN